jgi:hypothetical protein
MSESLTTPSPSDQSEHQGVNDFKRVGYGGPCPPPGKPHRCFFKVYDLGTDLSLKPRATKKDLPKAMEGHILAKGSLMGTVRTTGQRLICWDLLYKISGGRRQAVNDPVERQARLLHTRKRREKDLENPKFSSTTVQVLNYHRRG